MNYYLKINLLNRMEKLLSTIRACDLCLNDLPLGPKPIVTVENSSKIIVIGQAPGTFVHRTGIAWNDQSGKRLRKWLAVSDDEFYNTANFGIMPMGFCYPGKGKSGDLPPKKICAKTWHPQILQKLKAPQLFLLIGQYVQKEYLPHTKKMTLTNRVMNYQNFLPTYFVLPHPSPRNTLWQQKNEWFEKTVVPVLQTTIHEILHP